MEAAVIIRAMIALPLVLLLPGYAWSRVLFGEDVDSIERVVLSIGLSIAMVPLAILLLNKVGMPVTATGSFFTITLLTVTAVITERVIKK